MTMALSTKTTLEESFKDSVSSYLLSYVILIHVFLSFLCGSNWPRFESKRSWLRCGLYGLRSGLKCGLFRLVVWTCRTWNVVCTVFWSVEYCGLFRIGFCTELCSVTNWVLLTVVVWTEPWFKYVHQFIQTYKSRTNWIRNW